MSFFGFDQPDLEREKLRFLEGELNSNEDIPTYTWAENYDGLGDALQEGGDELNDETFGGIGTVGKDFDFSNPALPGAEDTQKYRQGINQSPLPSQKAFTSPLSTIPVPAPAISLESIWDDKSPFSLRLNGAARTPSRGPPTSTPRQSGIRTLQEIEAEMRAAAEQSREAVALQQRQQQLLLQQQREEEEFYYRQRQQQEQQQEQELRQRLLYQQQEQQQLQQLQRLQQQQHLQQQREQQQHHRTPPPRMLPVSQSPRFLEHQRQILLLQQQQEQQQLLRLQQLEEQLRVEELERQLRAQQITSQNHYERQQPSGPTLAEMEARHQQQLMQQQQHLRQRSQSPAARGGQHNGQHNVPLQESMPYLPQSIQLQQRLLSEMAQAEFLRDIQGLSQADQEALRMEAVRKILETEKMEEKRRRKAAKIAHMSKYNDLMTQSDKDFITRIQVSQLVSQDPYADDFYAQVYGAIMRSRMGLGVEDERVLKFGSSGGVGLGVPIKGSNRRPSAMQRMQQQVERIVSNAKKREEEKGLHAVHSLQGALGRTSGRSYKASPRQLLQVESSNGPTSSPTLSNAQPHPHISKQDIASEDGAAQAARLGREALGGAADATDLVRRDPLTHREVLVTLETLYDLVMNVEQLKHDEPHPEEQGEAVEEWKQQRDELVEQIWTKLQVMVPLETSNPHPFISLLSAAKGKKLLPRVTRNLDSQRMFTLLTLLIACFSQLDVIANAPILENPEDTPERASVERQTQAFLSSVMQSILPTIVKGELRLVTGLLGLLMDRNDVVAVARTKPGVALLTLLLTRVELIKQSIPEEIPSSADEEQWQMMFDHLFQLLTPHFTRMFPTRTEEGEAAESQDQPVWQFLAALALHATIQQHQILVTSLREKVLENVVSAKKGWGMSEEERQAKLANVDLFLHALGLESSQITV
ncbi:hypothetical protein K435DRAFT_961132 [Dendrothele bispora CBS 962.96]|uniref:mRNA decay factor PAT1 domain-containing protein n=1 Tax=Dendrothele bispora (strain CBS 962.96) TaxID=1314807 RepID=A0A4S8MSN0_DENBC|nr:hypothetical protein K435DRAFT_961132 [Dendrothele bispora CBS 962.96]